MRQAIILKNPNWKPFDQMNTAFKSEGAGSVLVIRSRCKEIKIKPSAKKTEK